MAPRKAIGRPLTVAPASAISDGGLLGKAFSGPSWRRWRAILKAAYGEPLDAAEEQLFREVAERAPPPGRVRELWCVVGRRGGKDSVASAIATVAALGDYSAHLRPGERASVLCLASDRAQAKIVHRYIRGYFNSFPLLRPLVSRETDDVLELTNNSEIIVSTNDFRAVRGRTVVCAILDEVAFYSGDNSASPDSEMYGALQPTMATIPDAMLIAISSPYRRAGLLFQKWQASYGKPDDSVLVVRGASKLFNPTLPQRIIDDAMQRDPEVAASEYLAEWRSDLSDFIGRDLLDAAIDEGVVVRPPLAGVAYVAHVDPSGGRGDSFAAAIAHAEGDTAILDCLFERRSPFDPSAVVAEVADLLRSYGVATITGDKYAASWVQDAFAAHGIRAEIAERDRTALYVAALPLFASGRVRLLASPRLVHQFASLERRTSAAGRDIVNHPAGGADDLANAAAGALVRVASEARPALIRQSDLLVRNAPVPMPTGPTCTFAVLIVSMTGMCAACHFAAWTEIGRPDMSRAVLLDFDTMPLTAGIYDQTVRRVVTLFAECGARIDGTMYVQPGLEEQVKARGLPCEPFNKAWLAEPEAMAVSVASHVAAGSVKISELAYEKSRTTPLTGALTFPGGRVADDPLRLAWLIGVRLAMGD